jgi:hypothetical protein
MKGDRYQFTAETQSIKQVIDIESRPRGDNAVWDSEEWRKHIATITSYPADSLGLREDRIVVEGEDFEFVLDAHPDWRPTYNNPDDPPTVKFARPIHKEKQQSNSGEQNSSDVISLKLDYYDLFHVLKQLQRDDISVRQAFQIITGVKYKTPKTNNHE